MASTQYPDNTPYPLATPGYATSEGQWRPTGQQLLIMLTLSVVSFMVALDACIIVTSLAAVVADLHGETTQGIWVGTAYLLSSAVFMPFLAEISDVFGRQAILLLSLAAFAFGTLLCCLASSMAILLAGRTIQGIGGGGILVLSQVIFADMVPLRYRPKWYGIVLGAWALGNCVGPVLGGAIAQNTTWRWIFYIMFPFNAFGLLLAPCLPTLRGLNTTSGEKFRSVDWTGGLSFIISATLFLIAISWGGVQFGWRNAGTLAPLCLGSTGLLCTGLYEARVAKRPFIRHSLFWNVSSVLVYICGTIQGLVIYGQLYYIPFYFLSVKGYSPTRTGVALLPVMCTMVPSSIVSGQIVTYTNDYRWSIWLGWAFITIGSGLALLFGQYTTDPVLAGILIILGIGHGSVLTAQNFASPAMCKSGEETAAAAIYAFLRQLGMALGVGVGGSAFQNTMGMSLERNGLPVDIARQSQAFVAYLPKLADSSFLKTQILEAYISGFRAVHLVYVGISGLAFLLSLFIKPFDMNKMVVGPTTGRRPDDRPQI